jgi:hypothetical protein
MHLEKKSNFITVTLFFCVKNLFTSKNAWYIIETKEVISMTSKNISKLCNRLSLALRQNKTRSRVVCGCYPCVVEMDYVILDNQEYDVCYSRDVMYDTIKILRIEKKT